MSGGFRVSNFRYSISLTLKLTSSGSDAETVASNVSVTTTDEVSFVDLQKTDDAVDR